MIDVINYALKTFPFPKVEVRDNGRPEKSSTARVLLKVGPTPASSPGPPVIVPPPKVHLMETDPPGHLVTFITATPAAGAGENPLWYYIAGITVYITPTTIILFIIY